MSLRWTDGKPLKILDFDMESRPLAFWYEGATTAEITAVACCWVGSGDVQCRTITLDPASGRQMLEWFLPIFNEADMVTGHNLIGFDLPILNAAMMEFHLPMLQPKMVQDTHKHLRKRRDLSASQESLAAMYGLPEPKRHMTQTEWRTANRLTPDGITATIERVKGDVLQHMALRQRLIEAGALKSPRVWTP